MSHAMFHVGLGALGLTAIVAGLGLPLVLVVAVGIVATAALVGGRSALCGRPARTEAVLLVTGWTMALAMAALVTIDAAHPFMLAATGSVLSAAAAAGVAHSA